MTSNRKDPIFLDRAGRPRWHEVAGNNKIVATSGESFASVYNAQRAYDMRRAAILKALTAPKGATPRLGNALVEAARKRRAI
jgi:uncharacterized protein YegP (UPF0339 family)